MVAVVSPAEPGKRATTGLCRQARMRVLPRGQSRSSTRLRRRRACLSPTSRLPLSRRAPASVSPGAGVPRGAGPLCRLGLLTRFCWAPNTRENLARLNGTASETATAISENDLFIKDAFLVFRALCKLSMKPLGADRCVLLVSLSTARRGEARKKAHTLLSRDCHHSERDLKSPAMRSKLLSLHLVLTILHNHMRLFVDPQVVIVSSTSSRERTPFLTAVKQYLCLALSRNAVSPVIQVFELSCEIFSRMLSGMRQRLKKEIEVLLNEIFFPILEMRTSTVRQKSLLLAAFARLSQRLG